MHKYVGSFWVWVWECNDQLSSEPFQIRDFSWPADRCEGYGIALSGEWPHIGLLWLLTGAGRLGEWRSIDQGRAIKMDVWVISTMLSLVSIKEKMELWFKCVCLCWLEMLNTFTRTCLTLIEFIEILNKLVKAKVTLGIIITIIGFILY